MKNSTAIIARGQPDDRLKLAAIARFEAQSGSEIVIQMIRSRYRELFGDTPPPPGVKS